MREDDCTVEERLAVALIREFEDLDDVERLIPPGHVLTPDWRVTTADGRVADVEVTWDTNEAGRRFESQLVDEQVDDRTLSETPLAQGVARSAVVDGVERQGLRSCAQQQQASAEEVDGRTRRCARRCGGCGPARPRRCWRLPGGGS